MEAQPADERLDETIQGIGSSGSEITLTLTRATQVELCTSACKLLLGELNKFGLKGRNQAYVESTFLSRSLARLSESAQLSEQDIELIRALKLACDEYIVGWNSLSSARCKESSLRDQLSTELSSKSATLTQSCTRFIEDFGSSSAKHSKS